MKKFEVYKDDQQWVPLLKWFWRRKDENADEQHGPYTRAGAYVRGFLATL